MGLANYPTTKNGVNKNESKWSVEFFGRISRKYYFAEPAAASMKTNREISKNRWCADVESIPCSENRNDVRWADPNHQAKPIHKDRTSGCPKWTGAEFCSQKSVKFPQYWNLDRDKLWPVGYWIAVDILICWTQNRGLESESSGPVTVVRPMHNSIKYWYKQFFMLQTWRGERDRSWAKFTRHTFKPFSKPGIHAGKKRNSRQTVILIWLYPRQKIGTVRQRDLLEL